MANAQLRAMMDALGDHIGDWQGVPVPLPDLRMRLYAGHPMAAKMRQAEGIIADPAPAGFVCAADDMDDVLINQWFSYSKHATVYLLRNTATGRYRAVLEPVSVDHGMRRLTYWLTTIGASDAWRVEAEAKAMEKLTGLLSERQVRHYFLTGSFLETSPRSQVTYMFRRLRPTVALTPRQPERVTSDAVRCLAVLCLHPVGYYAGTWGGCMVPTDDVIAHLMLMRGDEKGFWRQANQHPAWHPEAGL